MKTSILFSIGFCFALAPVSTMAQARTWSFSKDTVYEWKAHGDSVMLVNQSVDTVRFDSVFLELQRPSTTTYGVSFGTLHPVSSYDLQYADGHPMHSPPNASDITVPGMTSKLFYEFLIDIRTAPLAKRVASSAVGDTMAARLIFSASSGRGRDTVIVLGTQQQPTSLFHVAPRLREQSVSYQIDLLGRKWRTSVNHKTIGVPLKIQKE